MLSPIAGAAPAGPDGRYDPEHEALRVEIAKLENPAGAGVDWKSVHARASAFLQNKSKDILVASYYAGAELELHGLDGLSTGFAVLSGLIGGYWDDPEAFLSISTEVSSPACWALSRSARITASSISVERRTKPI